MISDSIVLMTLVDILIIGVFAYAFQAFRRLRKTVDEKQTQLDFLLIALGMAAISVFYLFHFLFLQLAPFAPASAEIENIDEKLHGVFEWIVAPAGFVSLVYGFSRSVLHSANLHSRLKENQTRLSASAVNAENALARLNEREAELRQKNANFKLALENMNQGLCVFDDNKRLVVSNDQYASLYGLPKDMIKPGTHFRDILQYRIDNNVIMGYDPQKYIEERVAAVSEKKSTTTIHRLTDGRVIVIAHRPMADGGWVATHEDITELAKAESMNQRLARIVENSINEIYVYDAETLKFIQVNPSACKNLGYSMAELKELTPLDLKTQYTRDAFEKLVAPLRNEERKHIRFETTHRRKDGTEYDVAVTLQLISSQNEQVFAAVIEDMTERKQVHRDLQRSQELFSKAFHANPIPFSISGPEGAIFDVNDAWLKTLGYTRDEAIGNSALKLGVWADPADRAHFVDLLKQNGSVEDYETQYVTKDGEHRDMVVSGEWLSVRGEARMFNISHDVTERKATERQLLEDRDTLQDLVNKATAGLKAKAKELEAALEREKELNELQRQFVSMASHEFRTPLAIIDSTAQRLMKNIGKDTGDKATKRVEKIRHAVERMTRLMESTLTAAKLDEGKIGIELSSCSIGTIVAEVCARQRDLAPNHQISYHLKDLPQRISADAGAIDQILTNLLSNAVKYSPPGKTIDVSVFTQENCVVLQVKDQGLGIDADDLPNMFSRFFRAKSSTGIAGTGIGLNLVKKLVDLHEGEISVESERGKGSVFTVRLPIDGPRQAVDVA